MYYARGGDSLCFSTNGKGNAVLIKSAIVSPELHPESPEVQTMVRLNPVRGSNKIREYKKLCSGQTLLCSSLYLKVNEWDGKSFIKDQLYIDDRGYYPDKIIQTTRLGIKEDRDAQLPYRFIDSKYTARSTKDVMRQKNKKPGRDYHFIEKNY